MISRADILRILQMLVRYEHSNQVIAVTFPDGKRPPPRYQGPVGSVPKICSSKTVDRSSASVCNEFYMEVLKGTATYTTCPFGVELHITRNDEGVVFLQQRGLSEAKPSAANTDGLSRLNKKRRVSYLEEVRAMVVGAPSADLDFVGRAASVLVTGRSASAVRALGHQLLTPVQGALADAEGMDSEEDDRAVRFESLTRNLGKVKGLAQTMTVLLSTDLEVSANRIRKCSLKNVVLEFKSRMGSELLDKRVSLTIKDKDHLVVQAVPELLEVAISAILENAVKYSFRGFEDKAVEIEVNIFYDTSTSTDVSFTVRSFGCAITEEEIATYRLFELGYRGLHSTDRGRKGTGSGLYVARNIVEKHGGKLEINHEPQAGEGDPRGTTTVHMRWPTYQDI